MSVFESIVIGEGWISEHFFTSSGSGSFETSVKERVKQWDEAEEAGFFTPHTRFTHVRKDLLVELAGLEEKAEFGEMPHELARIDDQLLEVLGYENGSGLRVEANGTLLTVSPAGVEAQAPLVIIKAMPVEAAEDLLDKDGKTLLEPVALTDDGDCYTSVARLLSALFIDDDPPAYALVLAGRYALLAEKSRWAEGRYLAINLQLVAERNDTEKSGEINTVLTCLDARSLIPDAEGGIWWDRMLAESIKHTVGVSKDLRDGVRLSIELLAQEVVDRRKDKGLDPLPKNQAQVLARQSLRFLYRILFLLYAEASPELEVLPVGAPEYEKGYSLDRLRELVQVQLVTPQAKAGTHLYQSLALLFRLVDQGYVGKGENDLTFNSLRADLFKPEATALIDEVGLGNEALQCVLAHLLLSKEQRGRDRGFISYAELGINQLGAVYEGLMSYTGFFAETDLYEVAKGGDNSKGSWVVPTDRIDGISEDDFVRQADPITGELKPILHKRGSFVFRLAGRERQQSASYYTPEVLTRFTVKQALDELLGPEGGRPPEGTINRRLWDEARVKDQHSAAEILQLTVCEPALGSGAFAIEATRQLAERYLRRRQDELGKRIDPDDYPRELQKTKAYISLHNVYGVDLNATAVELAEISLWLDTMVSGLAAPWFGLHLKRGNSLIGARRAVYSPTQVSKKSWLTDVAREIPLTSLVRDMDEGVVGSDLDDSIHHFLLPAAGWGSAADAKEAKKLAPEACRALKTWRGTMKQKPTAKQTVALQSLARRVEQLWQFALQRLRVAEAQSRRSIEVWGADDLAEGGTVQREEIEQALADADSAFGRLRRVMDAWCALWFWPLTDDLTTVETDSSILKVTPPTLEQWIGGLTMLLGSAGNKDSWSMETLLPQATWDELGEVESDDLQWANAYSVEKALAAQPWLQVCERIAAQQGFFHWELDFATVFARGGFDLQVGNPPWVRPDWDEVASLGEFDPRRVLFGRMASDEEKRLKDTILINLVARDYYVGDETGMYMSRAFATNVDAFPHLVGLRPDFYRCFMEQVWRHESPSGAVALLHPETHFTDEDAGFLRQVTYRRLRRHWQFINELQLFEEVGHPVRYGVHVYGSDQEPSFLTAASLYHPDTVDRSLNHDGSGESPGLKDSDGHWNLRPHKSRIIHVDEVTLETWDSIIEEGRGLPSQTRMVYAVNKESEGVLGKVAAADRVGSLGLKFSTGWNETTDRQRGRFRIGWGVPSTWHDVILKGPHLHVANPMYKVPNPTLRSKGDWSFQDLEVLGVHAIPATSYQRAGDRREYDSSYTDWGDNGNHDSARNYYRVAWRMMAALTNERTLICGLICPGTGHIHRVASGGAVDMRHLAQVAGFASSLLDDFVVRAVPKSDITRSTFDRLPIALGHCLMPQLILRTLRLNCLTDAYADLWAEVWEAGFTQDAWAGGRPRSNRPLMAFPSPTWVWSTPLRIAEDRRQALVEIDALVAVMLGVTADELCTIYRTQFPVLYGYDTRRDHYDANGRLVPSEVIKIWKTKGDAMTEQERTATNQAGNTYTYKLPFVLLDREADMRQAHAHFTHLAGERS